VGILNTTATSHSYAAVTFRPTGAAGSTLSGSTVITTTFTATANFAGRIAQNTGHSSADWLASVLAGTPTAGFTLGANSTAFVGQAINNVGGTNAWAPQMTVAVNDGSNTQHSQVSELTLAFNEPVDIVDLATDFVVKDASGNALSVNYLIGGTPATGAQSGVTVLVITFNPGSGATAGDTVAFLNPDPFGNTVGLSDGNFFLDTLVADVTNTGVALDGLHNGIGGSSGAGGLEVDEFWRLFGDTNGDRQVDATDRRAFGDALGTAQGGNGNYQWYLDVNEDGNIDGTDQTAFYANFRRHLNP
jgi:hypothetical protein